MHPSIQQAVFAAAAEVPHTPDTHSEIPSETGPCHKNNHNHHHHHDMYYDTIRSGREEQCKAQEDLGCGSGVIDDDNVGLDMA